MSNEKEFTATKVEYRIGGIYSIEAPFIEICSINDDLSFDDEIGSFDEGTPEGNAELICEAFNVATETGMTPLQLQSRIKELEDGVNLLIEDYKRRINAVNDLLDSDSNNGSNNAIRRQERLVTKRYEYSSFISDLLKLNNPTPWQTILKK